MPNKSLAIFKRAAAGARAILILSLIAGTFVALAALKGIHPQLDQAWQFLRGQSIWVLLVGGAGACAIVYFLISGIMNEPFAQMNSGFVYCYGHRTEHELYYEKGTLTFEDDRLIFQPHNKQSKSFMISYDRIISSETKIDNKSTFITMLYGFCDQYHLFIRYKDDADNEHVLEIALPHFTRIMAAVRQKLFSGKVETNSCTV